MSAKLLSFHPYELSNWGLIWIVSTTTFLYKKKNCPIYVKKNRTADVSQSNAAVLFLFPVLALSYKEDLMKVCIIQTIQHSRERFWKMYKESTSTETLDKNKKTLVIVFRCWNLKTNGQSLRNSFEVMNDMFIFNSFCV